MNKHELMIFCMLELKENPSINWGLHQLQGQRENMPDNSSNLTLTQTLITGNCTSPRFCLCQEIVSFCRMCLYL